MRRTPTTVNRKHEKEIVLSFFFLLTAVNRNGWNAIGCVGAYVYRFSLPIHCILLHEWAPLVSNYHRTHAYTTQPWLSDCFLSFNNVATFCQWFIVMVGLPKFAVAHRTQWKCDVKRWQEGTTNTECWERNTNKRSVDSVRVSVKVVTSQRVGFALSSRTHTCYKTMNSILRETCVWPSASASEGVVSIIYFHGYCS